jgi:hypothetical protein
MQGLDAKGKALPQSEADVPQVLLGTSSRSVRGGGAGSPEAVPSSHSDRRALPEPEIAGLCLLLDASV